MPNVLIEVTGETSNPFDIHNFALQSSAEAERQAVSALKGIDFKGIELDLSVAPVPMFFSPNRSVESNTRTTLELQFLHLNPSFPAAPPFGAHSTVLAARVSDLGLSELETKKNIVVWPNSELTLLEEPVASIGVDCRPFAAGVDIDTIRNTLGLSNPWNDGFKGQGVIVGVIDEGVDGNVYPVTGGFSRSGTKAPGTATVTSHGSMCAADILIAAPDAKIYDYPFLGIPNSGGALQMFQAVLDQRRRDGTPHITSNSYGFIGVPPAATYPRHEIHDLNHPLHRKIREVIASGIACLFAAGNCGKDCPSGNCDVSGIGPGKSIHASNSLHEVITVAAVNNDRQRIGYSSQGPGMFERNKPDIASYSHIFANFGQGRPGGIVEPFDSGTSAATPVAAGVAAMLLSAFPKLTPAHLKQAFIQTAIGSSTGWNRDFGNGIIDAGRAYQFLRANPIV